MSSIHTAFLQQQQQQQQHNNYNQNRIFLFNDHSVACLLFPGLNSINVDSLRFGPTCGLIPIGADQVRCETTGLKWNLDKETALSFSSLVSSSNAFLRREGDDDAGGHRVITLHTDKPLLWTMELR